MELPKKNKGNPNILEVSKHSTGPKTELGKFMRKVKLIAPQNIPHGMQELYDWYKGFNTKEVKTMLELNNIYNHLKTEMVECAAKRKLSGEGYTSKDLAMYKLIKETLVDIHKLIHGEKKTVKHEVTIDDIRNAMFSEKPKKIIEVSPDGTISQDMDRSGRGEGTEGQNGKTTKNNQCVTKT